MNPGDYGKHLAMAAPCFLGGAGCIYAAFHFGRRARNKLKYWTSTSGIVVDYISHRGSTCFYPQVQFQASDGNQYTFMASAGSGRLPYPVGSQIAVIYKPDDPRTADIKTPGTIWMPVFLFLFLTFIFIFLGISALFGN